MTKSFRTFISEGLTVGQHAESLYGRGYKHYGSLGQGDKEVHIFTSARGKVDHHFLLKRNGTDPVRHEGPPDLVKIKKSISETTDIVGIQKAASTRAQHQDQNVSEALPKDAEAGDYIHDFVNSKNKMFKGDSKKERIKRALGAYYGRQKNEDFQEDNDKPKELGHGHWPADYPATHTHKGVTYWKTGKVGTHIATGNPSAEYSWRSSGLTNPSHPHGSQEHRVWRDFKTGKSLKEDQDIAEAYNHNISIRHAINHADPQARHHARKFRDANKEMTKLTTPSNHTHEAALAYSHHSSAAGYHAKKYKERLAQLDAGKNKNEDLQEAGTEGWLTMRKDKAPDSKVQKVVAHMKKPNYNPKKHDERLRSFYGSKVVTIAKAQLKEDEDLQELSKKTLGSYVKKAHASGTEAARDHEQASNSDRAYDRAYGKRYLNTLTKRRKGVDMATDKLTKEDSDLQELSKKTLGSYVKKAEKNMDDTFKNEKSSKKWDRITWKRAVGIGRAEKRLDKKEELVDEGLTDFFTRRKKYEDDYSGKKMVRPKPKKLETKKPDNIDQPMFRKPGSAARKFKTEETEKPHPKGTRVIVHHKGHKKPGRVIRHDPGGPDSSPFYVVDVGEYGSHKVMAHQIQKEDLDEGLLSRIKNAAKKLNKSTQYPKDRYDSSEKRISKRPDSPAKTKALTQIKRKRDHYGSGEEGDFDSTRGGSNRGFGYIKKVYGKEDLDEGLVSQIKNAVKTLDKKLMPAAARIERTREKVGYDNAKGTDLRPRGKALRKIERIEWEKQNPVTRPKPLVPMPKLPEKIWEAGAPSWKVHKHKAKQKWMADFENHVTTKSPEHSGKIDWDTATHLHNKGKTPEEAAHTYYHHVIKDIKEGLGKTLTRAVAGKRIAKSRAADLFRDADDSKSPEAANRAEKAGYSYLDIVRGKGVRFGRKTTSEELEPKDGKKFLKEKPKRDPNTGKLEKSKAGQKVEDCIKMSGKKEKIDTEPTYNPLVTSGNGSGSSGTPNA